MLALNLNLFLKTFCRCIQDDPLTTYAVPYMHLHLAVFSALQLQEANTGELKCNCFKNTSTLLCMENNFCEPSLLTKYLKQLHPCREEAGCAICPNSSHQLLSFPSLAGQPRHRKADGQRQNGKQATVAEENKHGSVSSRTLLFTPVL